MRSVRVIPCLLLRDGGLWKTRQFDDPVYVGDPINTTRLFNDKDVDELVLLDISATLEGRRPDLATIADVADECFAPFCYGGGIRSLEDVHDILAVGVEKVSLNAAAVECPELVGHSASRFGSQSVVVAIDVRRGQKGFEVVSHGGHQATGLEPVGHARAMEAHGAGELLITSVDREGTSHGYDLELVRNVSDAVSIPVVAHGGAGTLEHLGQAVHEGRASAVAAGSLFVFVGPHRAVLVTYPDDAELEAKVG